MNNISKSISKCKEPHLMASMRCPYKTSPSKSDLPENFLPVICRSPRVTCANQLKVGEHYYIDRNTLYIDRDGDAYATVLKEDGLEVGNMLLSHFKGE